VDLKKIVLFGSLSSVLDLSQMAPIPKAATTLKTTLGSQTQVRVT